MGGRTQAGQVQQHRWPTLFGLCFAVYRAADPFLPTHHHHSSTYAWVDGRPRHLGCGARRRSRGGRRKVEFLSIYAESKVCGTAPTGWKNSQQFRLCSARAQPLVAACPSPAGRERSALRGLPQRPFRCPSRARCQSCHPAKELGEADTQHVDHSSQLGDGTSRLYAKRAAFAW